MTLRRRAPRPLSLALASLERSVAPATLLARIQQAWPAAVGDVVAANASPLRERGGTLTVYCPQAVWAQEVSLMAGEVVANLNRELGDELVRAIRTTATPR
jgi:predicted nucleic acid-binding Zn ribbon protein